MVALPSDGSVDPVTANSTSGVAQYGPALIFQSGQIAVSTQGTPGTGSVTSSARITGLPDGPGPFRYKQVSSTCTATDQGPTGAASIGGGVLETKYDVKTQEPVKTVDLPASPAVGAEYTGTIDHVGDHYKIVFNEQSTNPDGSLTVNAAHMYLLGPIAKGEMIIGQSVCGVRGATAGGSATAAPTRSVAAAVRTRSTVLPVALGGAALAVLASVLFVVRRRRGSALTDADGD